MSPWESAGGSRDTLLGSHPIPCHARQCSVKERLNQQSHNFLDIYGGLSRPCLGGRRCDGDSVLPGSFSFPVQSRSGARLHEAERRNVGRLPPCWYSPPSA